MYSFVIQSITWKNVLVIIFLDNLFSVTRNSVCGVLFVIISGWSVSRQALSGRGMDWCRPWVTGVSRGGGQVVFNQVPWNPVKVRLKSLEIMCFQRYVVKVYPDRAEKVKIWLRSGSGTQNQPKRKFFTGYLEKENEGVFCLVVSYLRRSKSAGNVFFETLNTLNKAAGKEGTQKRSKSPHF